MAEATYKTSAIVLRKTKLREKDLIVTLLDERGSLVRCVAKGARRPGGSLAARLELFSVVDVMLARGRNLDVVADARFSKEPGFCTFGVDQAACAACVAELLGYVAQEGLDQEILFRMGKVAFPLMADSEPESALALTAAALLKIVSAAGFRPRFRTCAVCGGELEMRESCDTIGFSALEGGCVCRDCPRPSDTLPVKVEVLRWCWFLMEARFSEVTTSGMGPGEAFSVLRLCQQWVRIHLGRTIKSLDFLLSAGLF